MGEVVLLSLISAINPTLLVATTVMLLLPHPERLMLGYWLGAVVMSVTLGGWCLLRSGPKIAGNSSEPGPL